MSNGTAPRRKTSNRKNVTATPEPARSGHDEISRRAFEIYLSRGGGHGHDMDDWLKAEQEIIKARATHDPSAVQTSPRTRARSAPRTRASDRQQAS